MTRIDFYIIKESTPDVFTCRLSEKIYKSGLKLFINTSDQQMSEKLDQLLWTFHDQSFIPHTILSQTPSEDSADEQVQLSHEFEPKHNCQVLINLSHEVPNYFSRCERVAEVITATAEAKQSGRERYKFYRDRGYQINSHEI